MDEINEFEPPDIERRPRYRVMLTIVDRHAAQATMEMYDVNTVEVSRGPTYRDPFSGLMVRDVRVHLPAAHALTDEAGGGRREAGGGRRERGRNGMPHDLSTPLKCLALALDVIESYQLDIRNSEWTGVDLLEKGFCQGSIYLRTTERLQQALAQFEAVGGRRTALLSPTAYRLPPNF